MNTGHATLCSSPEWARHLAEEVLPAVLSGGPLAGGGPGVGLGAGVCFTMLHHVPSVAMQDALFAEARRVLAPGGVFAGSDSIASPDLRAFHEGDTYVPVDPATLPHRLTRAGFAAARVSVTEDGHRLTFSAGVPS